MTERELKEKIRLAEEEAKRSGPIHSRDMWRHVKRLRRQLFEMRRQLGVIA